MMVCTDCGCIFDPDDAAIEWEEEFGDSLGIGYYDYCPEHNVCGECIIHEVINYLRVGEREESGGDW